MEKMIKLIRGVPVSIERKSTTDIEVVINGYPVLVQAHRLNTFFTLIERCFDDAAIKQGCLLNDNQLDELFIK